MFGIVEADGFTGLPYTDDAQIQCSELLLNGRI
jgi:hypothetical protein